MEQQLILCYNIVSKDNFKIMKYWTEHERLMEKVLANKKTAGQGADWLEEHLRKTSWLQAERLVHLLVTLAFGFFSLISLALVLFFKENGLAIMTFLFTITTLFYVVHYYHLENRIQKWYRLADRLKKSLNRKKT